MRKIVGAFTGVALMLGTAANTSAAPEQYLTRLQSENAAFGNALRKYDAARRSLEIDPRNHDSTLCMQTVSRQANVLLANLVAAEGMTLILEAVTVSADHERAAAIAHLHIDGTKEQAALVVQYVNASYKAPLCQRIDIAQLGQEIADKARVVADVLSAMEQ